MSASCYDEDPCIHESWECRGGWHECNDCSRGLGTRDSKLEEHKAGECSLCDLSSAYPVPDLDIRDEQLSEGRHVVRIVQVGSFAVSAEALDQNQGNFDRPFIILVPEGHGLQVEDKVVVNGHGEYSYGQEDRDGSILFNLVHKADRFASGGFITKDSGKREHFGSGMQRDTQEGKARWDLLFPLDVPYEAQFLTRVADLLARGAEKYDARNWEQASGDEELERFKASAVRHLMQWVAGDTDEDHASAVVFNLLGYETTKWKLDNGPRD